MRSAVRPAETEDLRRARVLVVDDDADARDLLSALLAEHGANVATAGSCDEALQSVSSFAPDVVLADLAMPDEDGFSLLRKLKGVRAKNGKAVPVIAVTALSGAEDRRRVIEAGFELHVTKPVERDELIRAVRMVAEGRASEFALERQRPSSRRSDPPNAA